MSDDPLQNLVDAIRGFIHGNEFQAVGIAVIILLITLIIARFCTFLLRKFLQSDGSPLPSSSILVNIARACVWLIGISIMLAACFNVNVTGIVAALGVGGIAVSLGLQNTIQNFFGGLQVTLLKIVKPGDHVVVGTTEGIVQDVSWRQTVVRDFEGSVHLIPNSILNSEEVKKVEPACLIATSFTFPYNGQDLTAQIRQMRKDARTAILRVAELKVDPWILLTGLGSGTVTATLRFVLKNAKHVRAARNAALGAIAPLTTGALSQPAAPPAADADSSAHPSSEQGDHESEGEDSTGPDKSVESSESAVSR